jgi:hypothetical protein
MKCVGLMMENENCLKIKDKQSWLLASGEKKIQK